MNKYRNHLPQLSKDLFITDGGLETTLVFDKGFDLPEFAAIDLFRQSKGVEILKSYYISYIDLAIKNDVGFILESPTWRASRDWGAKIGYDAASLKNVNRTSIAMLSALRDTYETDKTRMVISGCIGPRGDGYQVAEKMTAEQAGKYHMEQIETLSKTQADLVSAFTINYTEEAIGITLAAESSGIPVVIGFTVETNGRLPSGEKLGDAITTVDKKTGNYPAYYMVNCAHPDHFADVVLGSSPWVKRIQAIRPNASTQSHSELDEAVELDCGDPVDLGARMALLKDHLPHLNVVGGCCGTDSRHVEEICRSMMIH